MAAHDEQRSFQTTDGGNVTIARKWVLYYEEIDLNITRVEHSGLDGGNYKAEIICSLADFLEWYGE